MYGEAVFSRVCYYSGLLNLARWCTRRSGQRLIILNYHRASGGDLRNHMAYLSRHYRILHLEEALEELYTVSKGGEKARDRHTPLVLTFDDGYADNYTHAFSLAREFQIPITIFLIPEYIESGNCFWWLMPDRLVREARVKEATLEGSVYHLNQEEEREALAKAIYSHLCTTRSVAERETFLVGVSKQLNVPAAIPSSKEEIALKWAEVYEMEQSGWVSFGAHTMHHPVLSALRESAEVHREVSECRIVLEQKLGHPVRTFAYPLGRMEHIGDEGLQAVRDTGYDWAVTTIDGINTPLTNPYQLHRIVSDGKRHWLVVATQAAGVWQVFCPLFPYIRVFWTMSEAIITLPLRLLTTGLLLLQGKKQ